jgi:hypothetical protein
MYYEINVSKRKTGHYPYQHYFATAERSITTLDELKDIAKHFSTLFPEPEYKMSIARYQKIGFPLTVDELKEIFE